MIAYTHPAWDPLVKLVEILAEEPTLPGSFRERLAGLALGRSIKRLYFDGQALGMILEALERSASVVSSASNARPGATDALRSRAEGELIRRGGPKGRTTAELTAEAEVVMAELAQEERLRPVRQAEAELRQAEAEMARFEASEKERAEAPVRRRAELVERIATWRSQLEERRRAAAAAGR